MKRRGLTGRRGPTRVPVPLPVAVLVLVVLWAVTSCAGGAGGKGSPAPSSSRSPSPAESTSPPPRSSTDLPSLTPPTAPSTEVKGVFKHRTLKGTIRRTSEPACTYLRTDQGIDWVLTGRATAELEDGVAVAVRGRPEPQRETSCAGAVFAVGEVLSRG